MHVCVVYTEPAPRRQQFCVAPAMQQAVRALSAPLWRVFQKRAIKGYSHSFRITCDMSAVSLLESREQRYRKAIYHNNNNYPSPPRLQTQDKLYTDKSSPGQKLPRTTISSPQLVLPANTSSTVYYIYIGPGHIKLP